MLEIRQDQITSECWNVQFWGLQACERCKDRDTERCKGKDIRRQGKNALGFIVPIAQETDQKEGQPLKF